MEDFAKKLIVLVFLGAFFGALFLEFPLIYEKIKNIEIPALDFLRVPVKRNSSGTKNYNGYNSSDQKYNGLGAKDHSNSSRICVPALDGGDC